jgi:nucleoid DNA-binding protein
MIKKEIIEKISKYFKLTEFEAERVYDDIFSIIMTGVKEDNIVDIADFGEFIIKYNNGKNGNGNGDITPEYKKTVEFLASSNIEDELNPDLSTGKQPISQPSGTGQEVKDESSPGSIEEELRRKREEIISKISGPVLQKPPKEKLETEEGKKEEIKSEPVGKEEEKSEEVKKEEVKEEKPAVPSEEEAAEKPQTESDISKEKEAPELSKESKDEGNIGQKTFSDYFSEVKEKPPEEKKNVIPVSAVLLHNEITGGAGALGGQFPQTEPEKQTLQPAVEDTVEHKAEDDSYYIWYKDSESNPIDTQTLSYEYELLYQATKEAEYKSKLKIYVTSFILFFSIVLILLIFSPLLYRLFFNPIESPKLENTQQDSPDVFFQKAIPNVITQNNPTQQTHVMPPVDTSNKSLQTQQQVTKQPETQEPVSQQQTQQKQDVQKQTAIEQKQVTPPITGKENKPDQKEPLEQAGQQKNQTQQPKVESKLEGVTRNSMGWMDEKLKVIYIQLENGKFSIQESAWDSDSKANKRVNTVESYGIKGLKGNVVKADLGSKGVWFRVRFGEFSTLEEAHQKAIELRSRENMKIAMLFISFLMFA